MKVPTHYENVGPWVRTTDIFSPNGPTVYVKGDWKISTAYLTHQEPSQTWEVTHGQTHIAFFNEWSHARHAVETNRLDTPVTIVELDHVPHT
jgi:hypothetical protein